MECVKLTAQQRRSFEEDGFLVVRQVLTGDHLAHVSRAVDRLLVSFMYEPENHYLDLRPTLLNEEAVSGLVDHGPAVSLVAQLLGPNIHLLSTALISKKPEPAGTPTRRGWHRDLRMPKDCGPQNLPLIGIKVCYALTDFPRPDTGLTKMIRGSHLRTTPLRIPNGEVDPPDLEVCDNILQAGDAVLFDNRTYHSKAPNFGNSIAKVLMMGYAYRWLKAETYLDPPDPRWFEGADPVKKQLLGWYNDVDCGPQALGQWMADHGIKPDGHSWTVDEEDRPQHPMLYKT